MGERAVGTMDSPLRIRPGQTADILATRLVGMFGQIEWRHDKVQWVQAETACWTDDGGAPAVGLASRTIAAVIDAEGAYFDRHAYHNRQHFCEVMLATCMLAQVNRLPAREAQLLLLAALIHDLGHGGQAGQAFGAERLSIDRALPHLEAAGVEASDLACLTTLILATEPGEGVRIALAARRFHREGGAPPVVPGPASELGRLAHDAALARLAVLLCEADLLPSIALTFAHGMRLQERLATEWGRPLHAVDKLRFVDQVLASGLIGEFFAPNATAVRRELARLVDAQPPG